MDVSDRNAKQLRVNLIVNKWNGYKFGQDIEHSQKYSIDLPKEENRWEHENKVPILPEGVTVREIRCLYNDYMNHKKLSSRCMMDYMIAHKTIIVMIVNS